jgi:hypothetical protein
VAGFVVDATAGVTGLGFCATGFVTATPTDAFCTCGTPDPETEFTSLGCNAGEFDGERVAVAAD